MGTLEDVAAEKYFTPPDDEVKAIKIRSQIHIINHNKMSGYRTLCGKTASFGHQVYRLKVEEITCPECVRKVTNQHSEAER